MDWSKIFGGGAGGLSGGGSSGGGSGKSESSSAASANQQSIGGIGGDAAANALPYVITGLAFLFALLGLVAILRRH